MAFRRKDVAVACAAALAAWALSVSWIPSLRLTPYAFLGGVNVGLAASLVLLYLGARRRHDPHAPPAFPAVTSLSFSSNAWLAETAALKDRKYYSKPASKHIPPPISRSLDSLLALVLRDFVKSWYGKISTGQSFPNQIDRVVRLVLDNIAAKISSLDVVQLATSRLLPVFDYYLEKYVEAENAIRGKESARDSHQASEEEDIAIATKFNNGNLHPAASLTGARSDERQKQHLRSLIASLIPELLPAGLLASSSVLTLVREIVASAILFPAMQLFADPDFLNQHIEAYGRAVLRERKSVKKLRAALDEAATLEETQGLGDFPQLTPEGSEKTFEHFIRAIRQCSSLQAARRIQSELTKQIEHEKTNASQDSTFLRRLEIGRRLLDQRIEQLSDFAVKNAGSRILEDDDRIKRPSVTLRDVLYDSGGLSYLMEYMDRLDKMAYVQFWIVVDGLRNSSERIFDDDIEDQSEWGEAERQIINKINNNYFWRAELNVSPDAQTAVNDFLEAGEDANLRLYNSARHAILDAQAQVFRDMETVYFPAFKKSELYAKAGFAQHPENSIDPEPRHSANTPKPLPITDVPRNTSSYASSSNLKSPDLRRAIASSPDLLVDGRRAEALNDSRRSFDDSSQRLPVRKPLFDASEDEIDPLSRSTESVDSDLDSPLDIARMGTPPIVNAVQTALDDILDEGQGQDALFEGRSINSSQDPGSERGSLDINRAHHPSARPTLSSLGLLGTPSKRTVFNSEDLFGENEQLWEDENQDGAAETSNNADDIKKAAPGDLGLAEVVQSLSVEINKLEAQQNIVKSLLSKAELTNNVAELRILRKSQASLVREIRQKELQRQQYIVQENDNTLYGKAVVSIKNIMVGTEPDGHEFALYVIEISRPGETGKSREAESSSATWAVAKRYSEFHDLHRRLRRRFPTIRETEFPRRQMVLTLQKEFLKRRRAALERYLRELLKDPDICRSIELRAFLSQQTIQPLHPGTDGDRVDRKDFVTRIYNSVSDGMEEFLGNMPIIDQLSTAGQNLIAAATAVPSSPTTPSPGAGSIQDPSAFMPASIANDPASVAEARRELSALETTEAVGVPGAAPVRKETTFIAPIASAFLTLFQLRTSSASSWLRGRAVIIVLQQLLGGTVERRTRETFSALTVPTQVAKYIDQVREAVWPGSGAMAVKAARARQEKEKSRSEAGVVLAAVLIDVAGGVIGRGVAREGGRRLGRMISNERIMRALAYRLLDELVEAVWDIKVQ